MTSPSSPPQRNQIHYTKWFRNSVGKLVGKWIPFTEPMINNEEFHWFRERERRRGLKMWSPDTRLKTLHRQLVEDDFTQGSPQQLREWVQYCLENAVTRR